MQGPIAFYNISNTDSLHNTEITFSGYIGLANITGRTILHYTLTSESYAFINVLIQETTFINVTHNKFQTFAYSEELAHSYGMHAYNYPQCYFQYLCDTNCNNTGKYEIYTILFDSND